MKPEDLKSPFTWEKRHILVHDRIWYVPDQYEDFANFSFPGWNHSLFFEQERPICLEYCSGNGSWIAAKAQSHPEYNWVAIERKFDRVRKIWSKVKNFQLSNLLAVCGEGYRVTHHYIPKESIDSVYINFPDPWPKRRHAKYRIVQLPFIKEIYRILQPGGVLTMVTDDVAYSQEMIHVLHQVLGFQSVFGHPHYIVDYPDYGTSYFEDLWRQKGKIIRYHMFRKIGKTE
jgi:tRNA (guanine-N7-)-methyltransferase